MEKNFKKEYSKYIESETPDLWSRIESGLVEKAPSKVVPLKKKTTLTWKKLVPAAAAVVLLLVAAPIFAPRVMEKSSDMAMFDAKAENEALPRAEFAMDECIEEEGMIMEDTAERTPESFYATMETKAETTVEMPTEDADGGTNMEASGATSGGENAGAATDELKAIGIKVLSFKVLEKVPADDRNLLAIEKEYAEQISDLYWILVDGEEKLLAVPISDAGEAPVFEAEEWYTQTVTDSKPIGIDYIWVK